MNLVSYYNSIAEEIMATKNRIRNLMNDTHWLTDGEWKESVLRNVLRRYMPDNIGVGRGFIISENGTSKQIDVLLYDKSYPIIFRDGDLVFITPNAVKGFVEVKSTASYTAIDQAIVSLTANAKFLAQNQVEMCNIFVGLFVYEEGNISYSVILDKLKLSAEGDIRRVINHVCIEDYIFIKFWDHSPQNTNQDVIEWTPKWHAYNLRKTNTAYFINNLINYCSDGKIDSNPKLWFQCNEDDPNYTKEREIIGQIDIR